MVILPLLETSIIDISFLQYSLPLTVTLTTLPISQRSNNIYTNSRSDNKGIKLIFAWFSASKELIWSDIEKEGFQAGLNKSKLPIGVPVLVNVDSEGQDNSGYTQVYKLDRTSWADFLVCKLNRAG